MKFYKSSLERLEIKVYFQRVKEKKMRNKEEKLEN